MKKKILTFALTELNPIPTGFLNGRYLLGGAHLGPKNERLSKVVKTPQNAQNLISNNHLGI